MFHAKTLVTMAGAPGLQIDHVASGDDVLTYAQTQSFVSTARVTRVLHDVVREFLMIRHGQNTTYTLPEQPFFVDGRGWEAASSLRRGDKLVNISGHWDLVGLTSFVVPGEMLYKRVTGFTEAGNATFSTLVLDGANSFFANGVLVHG